MVHITPHIDPIALDLHDFQASCILYLGLFSVGFGAGILFPGLDY